jgi:predicted metal-binding membrane protein
VAGRSGSVARIRHDHLVVLPILLGLSTVAWLATNGFAGDDMRLGVLTTPLMTNMDTQMHMDMEMSANGTALVLFMGTWITMMVAMMFPAVSPVVLTYRRWAKSRGASPWGTITFVGGYLAIWSVAGAFFYGIVLALQHWVPMDDTAIRVGGVLVVAAGIYQLMPFKDACLKQCRSPLGLLMHYAPSFGGRWGPAQVGIHHGLYCLGCCWSLMLVLALLGMMNLVWMGLVAAVIFIEKVLPRGDVLSRLVGVGLILMGTFLTTNPSTLPAFI